MSLLLLEGCDDGLLTQGRWSNSNTVTASPAFTRFGAAIDYTSGTIAERSIAYQFDAAEEHATITVGFWLYLTLFTGGDNRMLSFRSDGGATTHMTMYPVAGGALAVSVAGGIYTSPVVWKATNTAHYIELTVTMHDTTGSFSLSADGNVILSQTGIDTKSGGTKTVYDNIIFQYSPGGSDTFRGYIDDIYLTNGAGAAPYNGKLGPIVVETKFPNGNGNYSNFVGSDGNSVDNYLLVDENPTHDSDTSYVESSTDTDRDTYTFENITAAGGFVLGVIATASMRYTGAADNVQLTTRIASTDYDGATEALSPAYAPVEKVWQVSPATAVDWTISEFDGSEFGIENVA